MTYQKIIDQIPLGLEKEILKALDKRIGKENAVRREDLLAHIQRIPITGFDKTDDRKMREAIELLRRKGLRICNIFGGDGYFIANTDQEYQEFKKKYTAYARTIFKTTKAMDECREVSIEDWEIIELDPIEMQMSLI